MYFIFMMFILPALAVLGLTAAAVILFIKSAKAGTAAKKAIMRIIGVILCIAALLCALAWILVVYLLTHMP